MPFEIGKSVQGFCIKTGGCRPVAVTVALVVPCHLER